MRIEHLALNVQDPPAVAAWYRDNLGMTIAREFGGPAQTTFLAAETGHVLLEIYHNPPDAVPDYGSMDPLLLHIAFECPDVEREGRRLTAAGATVAAGLSHTAAGDAIMMLRDPWGLAIQLVQRKSPMLK